MGVYNHAEGLVIPYFGLLDTDNSWDYAETRPIKPMLNQLIWKISDIHIFIDDRNSSEFYLVFTVAQLCIHRLPLSTLQKFLGGEFNFQPSAFRL